MIAPAPTLDDLIRKHGTAESAAKALIAEIGTTYFYLGGLLTRLRREKTHIDAGYPRSKRSFAPYAEDRFDLKMSTTDLLMRIFRVLNEAGIGAQDLSGTNYTRMRLIVMLPPAILGAEKDHWLLLARTLSAAKLDQRVRDRLSQLDPQNKAGRKPKRSNSYKGIQHGRHVSHEQYRSLLAENEQLQAEKEELEAALDHREPEADLDSGNLNETIAALEAENRALLEAYERQHQKLKELEQQIPVIAQNEDNPGNYMILNFTAQKKGLFNKVIGHARKFSGYKTKNDIEAYWRALELYDEILIQPQSRVEKERSLKRLAGILAYYGSETEDDVESNLEIKATMYEDVSRGIDTAKGHSWGGKSQFWQQKTRDTL